MPIYAPIYVNTHAPTPMARPKEICHLHISPVKIPILTCTLVSESPLFPTLGIGTFILNIRTAPVSEHHCHNPLGRMSESCQNPLGCLLETPGIHTGALHLFICTDAFHMVYSLTYITCLIMEYR